MATKTTGAEYKAYMADTDPKFWPENSFIDEVVITVNGKTYGEHEHFESSAAKDDDKIVIEYGSYFANSDASDISLETHFKRWRKAQTIAFLTVEVHKDKLDALKDAIKLAGGKVC